MHRSVATVALAMFVALLCRCSGGGVEESEPAVEVASALPRAAADATGADYPTPTAAPLLPGGMNPSFDLPDPSSPAAPEHPFPTSTGTPPPAPGDPLLLPPPVGSSPQGTTL